MRIAHLIGVAAVATLAGTACGPAIEVHTVVSPDAGLGYRRTFRVLPAPRHRVPEPLWSNHPMIENSIVNRALRGNLVQGFERRGYVVDDSNPDFVVAYYASARDKLEVSHWDYGYQWRPRWWRGWGRDWYGPAVTRYTEGTVIIDVLEANTKELLWRGQGVAVVLGDEQQYLAELAETVTAILQRFPPAQPVIARN